MCRFAGPVAIRISKQDEFCDTLVEVVALKWWQVSEEMHARTR